jgi:hypothetical protein
MTARRQRPSVSWSLLAIVMSAIDDGAGTRQFLKEGSDDDGECC